MYKVKVTTQANLAQGFGEMLNEFSDQSAIVGTKVAEDFGNRMLAEVREYPEPPKFPIGKFPWVSERQRRFVLAKLSEQARARGAGDDIRYQRTFKFRNSWSFEVKSIVTGIVLILRSSWDGARFVVGTLNQRSLKEAAATQQPFHADRWKLVAETFKRLSQEMSDDYFDKMKDLFGESFTKMVRRRSRS